MQRVKKNDQSSEKTEVQGIGGVRDVQGINVAGFVLKNGWVFCQITFLIYMIILAVMDIKRRQVHLGFLLSGIIWVILSVICERTVSTGEIIAGILAGAFFF